MISLFTAYTMLKTMLLFGLEETKNKIVHFLFHVMLFFHVSLCKVSDISQIPKIAGAKENLKRET